MKHILLLIFDLLNPIQEPASSDSMCRFVLDASRNSGKSEFKSKKLSFATDQHM